VLLELLIYFCPQALFKTSWPSNALADNTDSFLVRVFPLKRNTISLGAIEAGMLKTPRAKLLSFGNFKTI